MKRPKLSVVPRPWTLLIAMLLPLGAVAGCGSSAKKPPAKKPAAERTAEQILEAMLAAYRGADAYQDNGSVRVSYKDDGAPQESVAPLAVRYHKPDRVSVTAYQLSLASDGENLRARILDSLTNDMDGQFVERSIGDSFDLKDIYTDQVFFDLLSHGLARGPVQLELLFSEEPLKAFLDDKVSRRRLPDERLDTRECFRVEVKADDGAYVLWIDRQNYLLHRLEYPVERLRSETRSEGREISDLSLVAEFFNASFQAPAASAFTLEKPGNAKVVERFVRPPQPLPTDLFGRRPQGYAFRKLDGEGSIAAEDLGGKTTVLVWFSNHPAGKKALDQVQQIRESRGDDVRFLAVCSEPKNVSDETLRDVLASWNCTLPVVRDLAAAGRDVFRIDLLPTLVVLDKEGVLHVFDESVNPALEVVLDLLAEGENVAANVLQQSENEMLVYQRMLSEAGATDVEVASAPTGIPEPTKPFHWKLEPLWQLDKRAVAAAGNLLAYRDGDATRLLIHDGWRSLKEVDEAGEKVTQRALDLPDKATVSFVRTVGEGSQRKFAAANILGRQVHVFDHQWKRLFSYPPLEQKHEGIRDVAFADLAEEGQPTLFVGYWSLLGVQAVSMEQKRVWSNRVCSSVQSLALTPPNVVGWRKLLVAGDTGAVHRINQFGNQDPATKVASHAVDQLFYSDVSKPEPGRAVYCALATGSGSRVAIGLNAEFEEVWSYDLPGAAYSSRVQYVTSGSVDGQVHWVFAGPDGSIHVLRGDGKFNDLFYTGAGVTGVVLTELSGGPALVLSSDDGVRALRVR